MGEQEARWENRGTRRGWSGNTDREECAGWQRFKGNWWGTLRVSDGEIEVGSNQRCHSSTRCTRVWRAPSPSSRVWPTLRRGSREGLRP
eukprot:9240833-Alexandrium_andersonii.AAC.1